MTRRGNRPETLLLAAFAMLLLAVAADVWLQRSAVPQGLRYVEIDSQVWVASGPLREVWEGARPHVAGYFERGSEGTPLGELAANVRKHLDEARIRLEGPADLAALGLDPDKGLVVAHRRSPRPATLIVLPMSDRARLVDTLERWADAKAEPRDAGVMAIGDMLLAIGDDGQAVLADDEAMLTGALARQGTQLDEHRSLDRDARRFALLKAGRASGAWLQGRVQGLPLVGDAHVSIEFRPAVLSLRASSMVAPGRSATLERALAAPPHPGPQGHTALARSDLAATGADAALADLLRLLSADATARRRSGIEQTFPGLLPQLTTARTLHRITVAALDTSQSVPGVVLGLAMAEPDADAVVLGVQAALRIKRDREILRALQVRGNLADDAPTVLAAAQPVWQPAWQPIRRPDAPWPGANTTLDWELGGPPLVENDPIGAARLSTAGDPLWQRYRGAVADAQPQPPLAAGDFAGADYRRTGADGGTLRYLMPPFTEDDLAWRLQQDERTAQLQVADLRAGRYRVCSAWRDGTLWVATDAGELERWLSRLRAHPALPDADRMLVQTAGAGSAKLLASAYPRALHAAAALHPDPEVREQRLQWLADLSGYHLLRLAVRPQPDRGEWHIDLQLVRP